ncbi:hypothetical protein Trydic_g2948 [Trypoxylus dichotomus]
MTQDPTIVATATLIRTMDKLINSLKEVARGYKMGQESMKTLYYADDAILMADNEDDLQRLLYHFQTKAESLNVQISMEKILINGHSKRAHLIVNWLQKINPFVSACNLQESLVIIWRNKHMPAESKVRIYKTAMRPALMYAAETRMKNMRRTAEMKTVGTIKEVNLRDQVRRKEKILKFKTLEEPRRQNERRSIGEMSKG